MSAKIKVLFLAADPCTEGSSSLRLDQEARAIAGAIRRGREREALEFASEWAVRISELAGALLQHQPQIVHFAGHGSGGLRSAGILLADDRDVAKAVDAEALRGLFASLARAPRMVILNACNSRPAVEACGSVVDYTIGMKSAIADTAAIAFAQSFYGALAFGTSVQTAFALAVNRLQMEGTGASRLPMLKIREGVDPSEALVPVLDTLPRPAQVNVFEKDVDTRRIELVGQRGSGDAGADAVDQRTIFRGTVSSRDEISIVHRDLSGRREG
jgi:hypothetical protein